MDRSQRSSSTAGPPRGSAVARPLEDFAAAPWRNGGGVTRRIAAESSPATGGEELWRVSVAELTGDAVFSPFPGYDRRFLLASDGRVALHVDGTRHRLGQGASVCFPGEAEVAVALDGASGRALNLMTGRGRAEGDVRVLRRTGRVAIPHGSVRAAMLLAGAARLADGDEVAPHGIVLPGREGLVLDCRDAVVAVVSVRTRLEP